jgi:hypothetical protein
MLRKPLKKEYLCRIRTTLGMGDETFVGHVAPPFTMSPLRLTEMDTAAPSTLAVLSLLALTGNVLGEALLWKGAPR